MNYRLTRKLSFMQARKWLAAALVLMLTATSMTGIAYAADTVTGIEFDYDASDYNSSTSSLDLKVESDKINLTVFASISGSTSTKNVTSSATWKSSSSSTVKVESGVLTGLAKGTATITATYSGYTASIKVTSDYVYDQVTIKNASGGDAPASEEIELGKSLIYTLDGVKGSAAGVDISSEATWSTSNAAVATVDDGTITLVGTGTTTITAKYKGKSDSVALTVSSPYKSIKLDQTGLLELEIGSDDKELEATVIAKDTLKETDVTDLAKWTSSNANIATVDKGSITPVSAGKATIAVSYLGVTTSIEVVVRSAYQSIKLTPEKEYHMFLHDPILPIEAEVLDNKNETVPATDIATWTSSNVIVATVNEGKVTPKGVGTTKITASHKGVSRSIEVTVYASINAAKAETTEIDGFISESGDLPKVSGTIFDGSKTDVSKLVQWTSSDEEVATIENGKWTAVAIGETVLTGKVQGYSVEVKLTVHVKPLKLIADTKEMSVIIGKETALPSVTVITEDGEEADVTKSIKWKTTSDNVVLKTESVKGLEASTVTLTGTYLNKSVTVKLRVEEEIVRLVVEPTSLALNPGRSKSIKVTGYYKDGKKISLGSKMNWEVNPDTLASINGSSVKALAVGSGKVTGSYQGKTVEVALVVTPKLKSLAVSSKTVSLSPGASFAVTLTANYTTGNPVNATENAIWTSSKTSVATVAGGKITAVSKGTSTIKASFGGKSITVRVTVK